MCVYVSQSYGILHFKSDDYQLMIHAEHTNLLYLKREDTSSLLFILFFFHPQLCVYAKGDTGISSVSSFICFLCQYHFQKVQTI